MQTEVMTAIQPVAWLEFYPPSGSSAETIPLDNGPFCVGRGESADLTVDSTRVSREHAILERRGGEWRIRDLKSTNGTFVNGERVEEAPLRDGDAIKVADVEFHFHVRAEEDASVTMTHVMADDETRDARREGFADWVHVLRRMREALLRGGFPNRYQTVYRLAPREVFGYEVLNETEMAEGRSPVEKQIFATECLLSERLRQVQRLAAVEEMSARDAELRLFVKLGPAEVAARGQIDALTTLRAQAGERPIVVAMPLNTVSDAPHFREFLGALRDQRFGVLYDNFAGRASHAALQTALRPDYVRLAPSVTRGVEQSSDRQRQVQAIARACQDASAEVIVQGITLAAAADLCRDLGCALAQGEYFQTNNLG